jgi:hypothetical protein
MISLRLAVPVVLVAAAVAGCFTYFVAPPPPAEVDQRLPPISSGVKGPEVATPVNVDRQLSPEEQTTAAFTRASKMILRQLSAAQASARTNELPISGRVPLPRRRPIPSTP